MIAPTQNAPRANALNSMIHTSPGAGFKYVDMASLLEYCRIKLQESDRSIQDAMTNLDKTTGIQGDITNLQSLLPSDAKLNEKRDVEKEIEKEQALLDGRFQKEGVTIYLDDDERAKVQAAVEFHRGRLAALDTEVNAFKAKVEETAKGLEAISQPDAAAAVRNEAAKALGGGKDEREAFGRAMNAQSNTIGASREMAMVHMQALVSQRGTMLQMTTNMISSLNKAAEQIAASIGH